MDEEVPNEPFPDENERRVPARPEGAGRTEREPQSRTHPGGGTGEVPEGGAIGAGPAVAEPPE